jgi:uncharacterized sodium:solute symporter family permease YidK
MKKGEKENKLKTLLSYMKKRGQTRNGKTLWFFLNLVFGVYFLNAGLKLVDLSKFVTDQINTIVLIIGGALIIVNGLMYMTRRTPYQPRYR